MKFREKYAIVSLVVQSGRYLGGKERSISFFDVLCTATSDDAARACQALIAYFAGTFYFMIYFSQFLAYNKFIRARIHLDT